MSYLSNRFFNALTSSINSSAEVKSLKEHINQVNAQYFGNGLKASRLHAYFADLMGTQNANKLTQQIKGAVDVKRTPLELFAFIVDTTQSLKHYCLNRPNILMDDRHPSILMVVPIIEFKTTGIEDSPENNRFFLALSISISVSVATGKVDIVAEQIIWDIEDDSTTDISLAWDMRNGLHDYLQEDNEMGYGELVERKVTPIARDLIGCDVLFRSFTQEQDAFLQAAFAVSREIAGALSVASPLQSMPVDAEVHEIFRLASIEPIKHNLQFERFPNPKMAAMPDIDFD